MMSCRNIVLLLLLSSSCNAWTTTTSRGLSRPVQTNAFTTTPRTPRFIDTAATMESTPLPPQSQRRKKLVRSLARCAGLFLVTSCLLLKPPAAFASETAVQAAETVAVQATQTAVQAGFALPQSLPAPVPPLVELQLTLRLLFASLLGAAVGQERSNSHKHSAGVRTMALVALGACAFTVCSQFGFMAIGGGRCDPSRMASNVASGVGFVGAGVITTTSANPNDSRQSIVHGLTTATAIWISAAIGVACGVGMLYIASAATLSTISILRYGQLKKKVKKMGKRAASKLQQQLGEFDCDPTPDLQRSLLLSSTKASLEEMNQHDDDWDSYAECVQCEDDDDEEEEEDEEEMDQVIVSKRKTRSLETQVELLPTTLLEQARVAAEGENLTQLVTSTKHSKGSNLSKHHMRNETSSVTEEYLRELESSYSGGRSNETLGP